MFYWIPTNQNIKNFYKNSVRQAAGERSLHASEQSVRITTVMLGQRSSLIGATVQAINIAIYDATERKSPVSKDVFSTRLKQAAPTNKGGDG